MMRNFLLVLISLVMGAGFVSASAFDDANAKFKTGDYAGAAAGYEDVLKKSGPDAAVFYNLGNSYQNLKQHGPAILAYERARLLAPRNPDVLANLALARKAAAAFEDAASHPKWEAVLGYLSRNEWSYVVLGCACFCAIIVLLHGVLRLPPGLVRWGRISIGLALLVIVGGSTALYLRRGEANRGIILTDAAAVRLSPFDSAESLGTPGPGRVVRVGVKNGGFQYVEVPGTGLRGWMSDADVALVEKD